MIETWGHQRLEKKSIDLSGVPYASSSLVDKLAAIRASTAEELPRPARYFELRDVLEKDFKASACIPYYSIFVHDLDGRQVASYSKFSRSFVQQIAQLMQLFMQDRTAGTISITDTGGVSRTSYTGTTNAADWFRVIQSAGSNTFGIVWGTGTNAEATTNTALQTIIAHGTSASQLSYGACAVGNATAGSSSTTVTITRSATNASGGTITTQELGVYMDFVDNGTTERFLCAIRDLNTQAVTNNQVITTIYTLDFAV